MRVAWTKAGRASGLALSAVVDTRGLVLSVLAMITLRDSPVPTCMERFSYHADFTNWQSQNPAAT